MAAVHEADDRSGREAVDTYPIAIVQDRYRGVYSRGSWLAIAASTDATEDGRTRLEFCLESDVGPSGSDVDAGMFWIKPPTWIAAGSSPDEALANLRIKQS